MTATIAEICRAVRFTDEQLRVLTLLAEGYTYDQIAHRMGFEREHVRSRLRTIYGKLGARNGVHAVALAYRLGILR